MIPRVSLSLFHFVQRDAIIIKDKIVANSRYIVNPPPANTKETGPHGVRGINDSEKKQNSRLLAEAEKGSLRSRMSKSTAVALCWGRIGQANEE